jgi:hypothetical protein
MSGREELQTRVALRAATLTSLALSELASELCRARSSLVYTVLLADSQSLSLAHAGKGGVFYLYGSVAECVSPYKEGTNPPRRGVPRLMTSLGKGAEF